VPTAPRVVAEIVLKAATAAHPKIRYAPGLASRNAHAAPFLRLPA